MEMYDYDGFDDGYNSKVITKIKHGQLKQRHLKSWVRDKSHPDNYYYSAIDHNESGVRLDRDKQLASAILPHLDDIKYIVYNEYNAAFTDDDDHPLEPASHRYYPAEHYKTQLEISDDMRELIKRWGIEFLPASRKEAVEALKRRKSIAYITFASILLAVNFLAGCVFLPLFALFPLISMPVFIGALFYDMD